uniref:Uncharacterized protein n=1 Tax=Arundo donax TaxID=35708 RepID=A0A0A9S541_ARUDO
MCCHLTCLFWKSCFHHSAVGLHYVIEGRNWNSTQSTRLVSVDGLKGGSRCCCLTFCLSGKVVPSYLRSSGDDLLLRSILFAPLWSALHCWTL